jgi:hypothetical protein
MRVDRERPPCPACGRPALDGHLTCGRVACDETGVRTARANAARIRRIMAAQRALLARRPAGPGRPQ